jgi:hypothetical protein
LFRHESPLTEEKLGRNSAKDVGGEDADDAGEERCHGRLPVLTLGRDIGERRAVARCAPSSPERRYGRLPAPTSEEERMRPRRRRAAPAVATAVDPPRASPSPPVVAGADPPCAGLSPAAPGASSRLHPIQRLLRLGECPLTLLQRLGSGLSGLTRGCSGRERSAGDWGGEETWVGEERRSGDWGEWIGCVPDLGFHRSAAVDSKATRINTRSCL